LLSPEIRTLAASFPLKITEADLMFAQMGFDPSFVVEVQEQLKRGANYYKSQCSFCGEELFVGPLRFRGWKTDDREEDYLSCPPCRKVEQGRAECDACGDIFERAHSQQMCCRDRCRRELCPLRLNCVRCGKGFGAESRDERFCSSDCSAASEAEYEEYLEREHRDFNVQHSAERRDWRLAWKQEHPTATRTQEISAWLKHTLGKSRVASELEPIAESTTEEKKIGEN
jgi:hypothetical protein